MVVVVVLSTRRARVLGFGRALRGLGRGLVGEWGWVVIVVDVSDSLSPLSKFCVRSKVIRMLNPPVISCVEERSNRQSEV